MHPSCSPPPGPEQNGFSLPSATDVGGVVGKVFVDLEDAGALVMVAAAVEDGGLDEDA